MPIRTVIVFLFSVFCISVLYAAQEAPAYKEYTYSEQTDLTPPDWFRFTADGSKMLVSDPKFLSVWDTETGKELYRFHWSLPPHSEESMQGRLLIVSSDGTKLAARWNKDGDSITIHNTLDGKELQKIAVDNIKWDEAAFCFSPDSSRLLIQRAINTAMDVPNLYCCDTSTGKKLWNVCGLFFGRDGMLKREPICRRGLDPFAVQPAFPFSNDGKKILAQNSTGNICAVLDAVTGKELYRTESKSEVSQLDSVFSSDGKSIFARLTGSGRIGIWDAETGKFQREVDIRTGGQSTWYAYLPNSTKILMSGGPATDAHGRVRAARPLVMGMGGNGSVTYLSVADLGSGGMDYRRQVFSLPGPTSYYQAMMLFDSGKRCAFELSSLVHTGRFIKEQMQSIKEILIWNVEEGYGVHSIPLPPCSQLWKDKTDNCGMSSDGKKLIYFYSGETPAEQPNKPDKTWIKWRVYDMAAALKNVPPTGTPDLSQAIEDAGFQETQLVGFALYSSATQRDQLAAAIAAHKHEEAHLLRTQMSEGKNRMRNLAFHTLLPFQVAETEANRLVLCVPLPFRGQIEIADTPRFKPGLAGLEEKFTVYASEVGRYNAETRCYDSDAYLRGNNGTMIPCPKEDVLRHLDDPNLYFAEKWQSDLYIEITGKPDVIKRLTEEPERFEIKVELTNLCWQQQGSSGYQHYKTLRNGKGVGMGVPPGNPNIRQTNLFIRSTMSEPPFDTVSASVIGAAILEK